MKSMTPPLFLGILLVLCSAASAQQFPRLTGGCAVSRNGLLDCDWAGAIELRTKLQSPQSKEAAPSEKIVLFTTTYSLAPGAPLRKTMGGVDNVIVALSDGSLRNEAKADGLPFTVGAKQVFLMPRDEPYLLRNVGEKELTLLVIELRNP